MREGIVVAEKPSVARAIHAALSSIGENVAVASVRGHVLDADLPEEYRIWSRVDPLELLRVRRFRYVVRDYESYGALSELFRKHAPLIIATDNDHEGELIGSEILAIYRGVRGNRSTYYRMRFNSVERDDLLTAWRNLEPELRWNWVHKAEFRRTFDLLTGAAYTRFLTLRARKLGHRGVISWGSCQTPTLYFVVRRDLEVESFRPRPFWYIEATLRTRSGETIKASSQRFWEENAAKEAHLQARGSEEAVVKRYSEDTSIVQRPTPLRTDDALRDLVRITGRSANEVLNAMERLYSEGYISYPRTDTNRYPQGFDYQRPLMAVLKSGLLEGQRLLSSARPRQGRLDDGAHPPIYPIKPYRSGGLLGAIWEYVARRFVANAFLEDATVLNQQALLELSGIELSASGRSLTRRGFLDVYVYHRITDHPIPRLSTGERLQVVELKLNRGETSPPPRMSESELIALMERSGIGTDATRASFPSLIVERGYVARVGKSLRSTELGRSLISVLQRVDERLVSPQTRRHVEEMMSQVERDGSDWRALLEESVTRYETLLSKLASSWESVAGELVGTISSSSANPQTKRRGSRLRGAPR
ncbi:MAG: type IA DNA topoisomerase [Thaumarchaeota archaeon]|nr:type IA DNA topoisomerase [Candidatus Calditenuaceae archaeon]MDW8186949.1 type IA DNA topoisomerase [Nitrososphaerota archaeon]